MNWAGASVILVTSTAGLHAYCIFGVLKERNNLNTVLSVLGLFWIFKMFQSLFSDNGNLFSMAGIITYFIILGVCYVIYFVQSSILKNKNNKG